MKKFNINELLKFLILLGFTTFFYYLILSKKLILFINPKVSKYTFLAAILFTILSFYQFTKIFTVKTKLHFNVNYIFMVLTLLIGFYSTKTNLNPNIANKKGINNKFKAVSADDLTSKNNNCNKKSQYIIFTDNNYFKNLSNIENDLNETYKGKKIIINGFIYKEDTFKKDEFVIARLMITCCAADSQVVGLMCKYPKTLELQQDTWMRVEGTLDFINNHPIIKVDSIITINPPENVYVYPSS